MEQLLVTVFDRYTQGVDTVDDRVRGMIRDGIFREIDLLLDSAAWVSAAKLVFAGIDAMATLALPPDQTYVQGMQFQEWVDQYIDFDDHGRLPGVDVYAARCGLLHAHGSKARLIDEGRAREFVYVGEKMCPPIRDLEDGRTAVSITSLAVAFVMATAQFLRDVSGPERYPEFERRLDSAVF